jgi:hypothetical protein
MDRGQAATDPGAVEPDELDEDTILIGEIGHALFGTQWRSDMGDGIGVNRRTIQRWAVGDTRPQPGVWHDLERLLVERMALQRELLARLRRRNGEQE